MDKRLPGLDLIRAYAAISVLLHHIWTQPAVMRNEEIPFSVIQFFIPHGYDAVNLFFVLSGFLITYLLLQEGRRGRISVRRFYMRRILRIWPLYYMVLLITLGVTYNTPYAPSDHPVIRALLFSFGANIAASFGALGLVFHFWSIGIEEQFYLLWPWTKLNRLSTYVAIIFACKTAPLILALTGLQEIGRITYFESMAIGGLGAWMLFRQHPFLKRLYRRPVWMTALALFLLDVVVPFRMVIPASLWYTVESIVHIILILNASSNPDCILHIQTRLTRVLGNMSYSIYMLHPLIIYIGMQLFSDVTEIPFYITSTMGTLIAAGLTYRLLEQPFLRLKNRFNTSKTQTIGVVRNTPTVSLHSVD